MQEFQNSVLFSSHKSLLTMASQQQLKNDDDVASATATPPTTNTTAAVTVNKTTTSTITTKAESKTIIENKYPLSTHPNDGKSQYGGRDAVGYGSKPPNPKWPNGAKLALNFVLNYEEGGENCLLHGDNESEKLLSEIVGAGAYGEFTVHIMMYLR